jgi:two-component system phosphate regulon sensor histidine kinase PhoR
MADKEQETRQAENPGDQVEKLLKEIAQLKEENSRLASQAQQKPSSQSSDEDEDSDTSENGAVPKARPMDAGTEVAPIKEGDITLKRLVQRIAMILQAEKVVIMFYDREQGELIGIPPSYGVEKDRLDLFKVRATHGVSGQVFREGEPSIFHDANSDDRTKKDMVSLMHVSNGVCVPLVIEKRDEENRVVDRTTIGVLHAFNKRHGEDFNEEDVRLLERMARNVGSIIANLQLYKEVIEEREELLQTFESLTSGLILVSPQGKVSQINSTAKGFFAVEGNILNKPYTEVIHDETLIEMITNGLKGEDTQPIEHQAEVGGLERFYQLQGALVRSEEGRVLGFVAIVNDVTEQKNLDRMKSAFVAMASHELRTPLTAIKGFVSTLIMDDSFEPEERNEFYQIIDQECDRLTRLINDLLNTARIEANESLKPNYTKFNLQNLVEKVITIQKRSTDTNKHNLFTKVEGELPQIIGDEDKIDQVLTNLLSNAIKYSPNGGDVILHAKQEGDYVKLGVEDQGMGIPEKHLNKVFEKFHRVHNEDNRKIYGTGLGLYLVKHLVEQVHMGEIWAESEVGKGSTFWVKLPVELDVDKAKEINQ